LAQAGLRYAASFILEYALWAWIALALAVAVVELRAFVRARRAAAEPRTAEAEPAERWRVRLVVATLSAHALYYVLVIGGDHFEYRVLAHLVLLAFVSFVALANRLRLGRTSALAALAGFVALSWPVPWTHFAASQAARTRQATLQLRVPIAGRFPAPLRFYARGFDDLQEWLIGHFVCSRHQEHKIGTAWWFGEVLPTREVGSRVTADGHPVLAASGGIGGLGWVLPHVAIIDMYGLNDYVVARTPTGSAHRRMAHERRPPPGYVERFAPNVRILPNREVEVVPRAHPLTAADIVAAEREWGDLASTGAL
jgi:arabinofuranosyltransferase